MNTKLRHSASFLCFLIGSLTATATGTEHDTVVRECESFVAKQLASGRPVAFSNGQPRALTGKFLSGLMSSPRSNGAVLGICISGAEIYGDVILPNSDCYHELQVERCWFKARVDLHNTHFHNAVSFADSVFAAECDLQDITVDGRLKLSNAGFGKGVFLSFAEVKGNFFCNGTFFGDTALLNGMKIALSADFDSSSLSQLATNLLLTTTQALSFVESTIADEQQWQKAPLRYVTNGFGVPVNGELKDAEWLLLDDVGYRMFSVSLNNSELRVFRKTFFALGADLSSSTIGSFLHGNAVCFGGPVKADGIRVTSGVYLIGTQFERDVSFGYASVGDELSVAWSIFRGTNISNFYGIKAGRAVFDNAQFAGAVHLDQSAITTSLEARDATFNQTHVSASLYGIKAKEIDLSKAEFAGAVNFDNATASGFKLRGAWFTNASRPVSFYGLKIDGTASFQDVVFAGPVSFLLMKVGGNLELENVRLDNALNPGELKSLTGGVSTYNADFGGVSVGGFGIFTRAQLAGRVSFRDANIENLHLDNIQLIHSRRSRNQLRLEGLSYKAVRAVSAQTSTHSSEEMDESWQTLEKLLQANTPYSFDIYDNLENYFRREGESGLADKVFIAGKRRERREVMDWWSPSHFFSLILDWTVGYGRHPSYALLLSLVPIAFGCWVFRRRYMVPENYKEERDANGYLLEPAVGAPTAQGRHPYHALWFSLDVFLPVIDLWADKYWMPRRTDKWRWRYMVIHKFLGWVLIPIGLAAFSGIIK